MHSDRDDEQPVIIVKKNGGRHHGHGGAWKVAYADFVTAMMAFFLVLWLVNQGEDVKQSVGGYFRDPVGFTDKSGKSVLDGAEEPGTDKDSQSESNRQREENKLKATGQSIMDALERIPGLSQIADRVEVEVTKEGLRIQLMESKDSTFFDLGSPQLSGDGMNVVRTIAKVLGPLEYDIIVEGHTDSISFSAMNAYSNWELSSDRANTARRILEESGVSAGRFVEIRAFADNSLRFPRDPDDPRNRRVSILVLNPFGDTPEELNPSSHTKSLVDNSRD
ncbi:MAG: OmpA family protein [candidate division Zixibacteria bacterium]|nr:OmpA family protein [candidate division Zixibacteria bacterium]